PDARFGQVPLSALGCPPCLLCAGGPARVRMTRPASAPGTGSGRRPGEGCSLGCPGTPGTRISPVRGGRLWIQRDASPRPGRRDLARDRRRRLMMDVENLLAAASENLSVRRAFGTAYEKDGMLIIPVALVAG